MWLIVLPDKWKRQVHYEWRYHPAELQQEAARGESTAPHAAARDVGNRAARCNAFADASETDEGE